LVIAISPLKSASLGQPAIPTPMAPATPILGARVRAGIGVATQISPDDRLGFAECRSGRGAVFTDTARPPAKCALASPSRPAPDAGQRPPAPRAAAYAAPAGVPLPSSRAAAAGKIELLHTPLGVVCVNT
jgi:hypothetical protein